MIYNPLGKSSLQVSRLGLGCANFGSQLDLEQTRKMVFDALDLGINFFDTADTYGEGQSEAQLGEVLGARRKDVIIATKFGMLLDVKRFEFDSAAPNTGRGTRKYILTAIDKSLKRLKTDWIDLYQYHCFDKTTPIEETISALNELIKLGKVRYIGCSNIPSRKVSESQRLPQDLDSFVACQGEYSLLARHIEPELVPIINHYGLGLIVYRPLACGILTGKYILGKPPGAGTRLAQYPVLEQRYMQKETFTLLGRLEKLAAKLNTTVLELSMSWVYSKSFVTTILLGATTCEQLHQNMKAVNWEFSEDELKILDIITQRQSLPIPPHLHSPSIA